MTRWEPDAAGRLTKAAIELFDEQGYDATTVAEIAERAGLTKRTFFRYFSDKREVLFSGSAELESTGWTGSPPHPGRQPDGGRDSRARPGRGAVRGAPPFVRMRAGIVAANPELQERELIKLQSLAGAIKGALLQRGVPENAAILAAQAGVTVFHVAFGHWVQQDDPAAFRG